MGFFKLIPYYLVWHYTRSIKEFWMITFRFLRFFWNYFSIQIMFTTLFSPLSIIKQTGVFGRLLGAFIKTFVILCGIFCICFYIMLIPFLFFIWLLFPIILIFILWAGFKSLIQNL